MFNTTVFSTATNLSRRGENKKILVLTSVIKIFLIIYIVILFWKVLEM